MEIAADLTTQLPAEHIDKTLCRRRTLLVLGAVNAGKSTLINALCCSPLSSVSKLPETKTMALYHAGGRPCTFTLPPSVSTFCRDDVPVLTDFSFIDTPGTNGFTPETFAITRELASSCDAILVVLAATNPWEPATWDAISHLAPQDLSKIIFVLQQADLRPQEDIQVLIGHVADLARKRCDITAPVFPVSLAGPVIGPDGMENPACSPIWQHIIAKIRNAPDHRELIADWKIRATNALRALEDHIDLTQRDLGEKNRLLDEVERDISLMHASFRRQLETRMEELAASFRMGNDSTLQLLRKRLRFLPSLLRLFGKDHTAGAMEAAFVERLKSAFQDTGKEDALAILSACRDHTHRVEARLRQHGLTLPLSEQDLENHLSQAGDRFRAKLEQAAGVQLESVRVRNQLAKELRRRNRALTAFTASCLMFLTLGAVAGALNIPWAAYSLCAASLLFLAGAFITAWRTTPPVLDVFDRHMSEACGTFAIALLTDYDDALHGVFRDYSETMLPLRATLSQKESSVKPLQKHWQELFLRLRTLEECG